MIRASDRGRRAAAAAGVLSGLLLALIAPAGSSAGVKDRAYRTPIARGAAAAQSHTGRSSASPAERPRIYSASELSGGLAKIFAGGGRGGAWVADAATDQILFQRGSGRQRQLASNMKLFTTAAALGRFGPDERLETTVWAGDDFGDGVVSEGLFLRGGGDPTLSGKGLSKLAARVRAAGVWAVQGPLLYDDSFLDKRLSVPQHGVRRESVGALSALTLGSAAARTAAQRFDQALRKAGVSIGKKVQRRTVPPEGAGAAQVAVLQSPSLAEIARRTNVHSSNFLAEMLLKDLGGAFGGSGTTRAGISVVQRFAAERDASVRAENGSGLSRRDSATPASVGSLLDSMLEIDPQASPEGQQRQAMLRDSFVDSLAVAGRTGTLAGRMRGSAAQGNCHAKTGTLAGVSALSGYCFRGSVADSEHAVVFSILMSGSVSRAHRVQDRAAALIARYSP